MCSLGLFHQPQVKAQIMHRSYLLAEEFVSREQMAKVCLSIRE